MQNKNSVILNVVVGHITPKFKLPNDWIFVSPSSKDKSAFSQYFDTSTPFLDNNLLGEYYYLFAVRKFLANHANYELVRISHYRRLASNIQIGLQSTNQPYSNFLSEDEISKFDIDEITTPKPHGWLIPSVFNMTVSAIHQYSMFHHIRDVFRFYADIVDDGVMEETSIYNCCFSNSIIPAPSISTIPAKEFIYIYEKLENSMLSFLKSGYCARDGYQTRVISFCLERLHSYLIFERLQKNGVLLENAIGFHTVISDTPSISLTKC